MTTKEQFYDYHTYVDEYANQPYFELQAQRKAYYRQKKKGSVNLFSKDICDYSKNEISIIAEENVKAGRHPQYNPYRKEIDLTMTIPKKYKKRKVKLYHQVGGSRHN